MKISSAPSSSSVSPQWPHTQPSERERSRRTEAERTERRQAGTSQTQPEKQSGQQPVRESVTPDQIARRAYELWEQDGRPDGRDQEHWVEAEKQLRESSFRKAAEAVTGDGDAHAQARAIKASAERRENAQTRRSDY